jgi:GatB/GatE catalytic domain
MPNLQQSLRRLTPRFSGSEVHRQIGILDGGELVSQETRGFNEDTGETFTLRNKEDAPDYRYMPDPNLPPLFLLPVRSFALTPRLSAHLRYGRSTSHPFAMRCRHSPMRLENVYRFAV